MIALSAATGDQRGWLRRHPYTLVAGIGLLLLTVPLMRRQDSEWENVFIGAARDLVEGRDLYHGPGGYLYPPFMAWTALPFLPLAQPWQRGLWLLLNAVCLVVLIRMAWRLAGGPRLQPGPVSWGEHGAALLGALAGLCYLQNCMAHFQTDVLIGLLLVAGCALLLRERSLSAATCFGVAAACKCTALLWTPYLLWRRRPVAALWVVVVAVGVNFLPDLVHRSPTGRPWLGDFIVRFLSPMTGSDYYAATWGTAPIYNQSLCGSLQRWLTTTWSWQTDDCVVLDLASPIRPGPLRVLALGIELALVGVVLAVCGRPFRRLDPEGGGKQQVLECALVLALMLLLSPVSSKAHFGVLVLPGFCLARAALVEEKTKHSRLLMLVLLAATVSAVLSNKDPLGERLYTVVLWLGSVTIHTLLLLVGCLMVVWKQRSPAPAMAERVPAQGQAA